MSLLCMWGLTVFLEKDDDKIHFETKGSCKENSAHKSSENEKGNHIKDQ